MKKNPSGRQTKSIVRGLFSALLLLIFIPKASLQAQSQPDSVRVLKEVEITQGRANPSAPLIVSTISKEQLADAKGEVSLPYIMELQPSVVASGENGKVGNTSMRIRGVDATRINVNINGVTLNDAESQTVYWVNIPNLSGMVQNLQFQRGNGVSVGGSAAMGGTISLQTLTPAADPYATADFSYGSWNTRQYGVSLGSGRTKHGFSFDAAYNGLNSDGFVRNGFCDHQSLFLTGSWSSDKTFLKALFILGHQRTGITWDGASAEELDADPRYNPAGLYFDAKGNPRYYNDEADNYNQRHYQLFLSQYLAEKWTLDATLHFTHGDGFYEEYKYDRTPAEFGLSALANSDYIVRKQEFNGSYTGNLMFRYKGPVSLSFGATGTYFDADHFGNVIWAMDSSASEENPFEWYRNKGYKADGSLFANVSADLLNQSLCLYADLQLRDVFYGINGPDDDFTPMLFHENYLFFNPKLGLNYSPDGRNRLYFVAGLSHREPSRADIKDILKTPGDTIRAEAMLDIELGYGRKGKNYSFNANFYSMLYKDQLTASGELSPSGYALMVNVDRSFRIGLELEGGYRPCRWFQLSGNFTFSQNKVLDYQYNDSVNLGTTDLALSPDIVTAGILSFTPWRTLKMQLIGKYVGAMYADNTSRIEMRQEGYFVMNAKLSYTWNLKGRSTIEAQLVVNNLLNHKYRLSAWAADYGEWGIYRGYYQQPGTNFVGRIIVSL